MTDRLPTLPGLYDRRVQAAIQLMELKMTPPPGFTQTQFDAQLVVSACDEIMQQQIARMTVQQLGERANAAIKQMRDDLAAAGFVVKPAP